MTRPASTEVDDCSSVWNLKPTLASAFCARALGEALDVGHGHLTRPGRHDQRDRRALVDLLALRGIGPEHGARLLRVAHLARLDLEAVALQPLRRALDVEPGDARHLDLVGLGQQHEERRSRAAPGSRSPSAMNGHLPRSRSSSSSSARSLGGGGGPTGTNPAVCSPGTPGGDRPARVVQRQHELLGRLEAPGRVLDQRPRDDRLERGVHVRPQRRDRRRRLATRASSAIDTALSPVNGTRPVSSSNRMIPIE